MGNVIRQTAAAADILHDVRVLLANAAAKGSPYKEDAERFLGPLRRAGHRPRGPPGCGHPDPS